MSTQTFIKVSAYIIMMKVEKDLLPKILTRRISIVFKHVGQRNYHGITKKTMHRCGEHIITTSDSRKSYAVVDVVKSERKHPNDISDTEMVKAGFKDKKDLKIWLFVNGYGYDEQVNLVHFEIKQLTPKGKSFLISRNMRLPIILGW
jgi:hypothetical protein